MLALCDSAVVVVDARHGTDGHLLARRTAQEVYDSEPLPEFSVELFLFSNRTKI